MDQVLKETTSGKTARLEKVLTIKPTPRIERLKESLKHVGHKASIDRARIETRVMKETEGEPMVTRRAKAFAAIVSETPIDIYPDELVVGHAGAGPRCVSISPADSPDVEVSLEGDGISKYSGLTGFDKYHIYDLSDEEKRELKEEIIPYWKGPEGRWEKTRVGRNCVQIPPELRNVPAGTSLAESIWMAGQDLTSGGASHHFGHNTVDYKKVLRIGFRGVQKEAEERLAQIDPLDPEEFRKIPFLKGVVMVTEAAAGVGQRFAARARELAKIEKDSKRKEELLKIAEVCDRVPANPAVTFYEAMQSYWFTWVLLNWEQPMIVSESHGRADQDLYPYYEKDIKEGRITKEEAQELLDCFILNPDIGRYGSHITVGGVKPDGNDATNELSFMFIESMMHTRLPYPFFSVQVHPKMSDKLLIKGCQLCSLGTGHPQFINTDVMVMQAFGRGAIAGRPVPLEDARAANPVGCLELTISGKDSGYRTWGGYFNLAQALEFVMTNGLSRHHHQKFGLETGDPRQFKTFEEVREAYRKQIVWMSERRTLRANIMEQNLIELSPTLYASALINDCIEKGISREEGGARYNTTMITAVGPTDAGDSLTAIKKLVFDDKKITMDQLCLALDDNFIGHEEIRRMLLKAPKFGNDDDYADEQTAFVYHILASESAKQNNLGGGKALVDVAPMFGHVIHGQVVGALPSGRLAGTPLNDAMSPSPGNDVNGPTAVLKSVSKVDNAELLGAGILNLKLDPAILDSEDGEQRLVDLIRTFVDQKIYHIQINIVSSDTLRAAQKEPQNYRDLVVKVAGYSAFFTKLNKELQDHLIARTEHRI
jgi:pyruvate formate-lyase/glycerol dehydratase family glycyl radical enzyme